ncbi:SAM-dependent MidA family methyltransferase [Chitinivorax tropicus]|uniref:SAM-dependent MidA family methyltransferase n=1 Tax=Chitinivorax tropicus TaxID=714531 RepID=A0A840MYK1_9PROT|nr:SAM-dependent methyltransferase [Chitinivorax tropicus]MBB5020231.1 SAM-dependent MidA family methyltransferase [Chitinivorax tropicus]
MSSLPTPSADALEHSNRLVSHIRSHIDHAQGWLSFADYMADALYAPGLGYYTAGSAKFGGAGDFTTAPEMTPVFGQIIAQQLAEAFQHTRRNILEFGAGSGKLALDILRELAALNQLPDRYYILDVSADLKERQWQTFQHDLTLLKHVEWIDQIPENFEGVMIGNEVLDAMPARLVHYTESGWQERGVSWQNDHLTYVDRPLSHPSLEKHCAHLDVPTPYLTEISLTNRGFIKSLADHLRQGLILMIDYGFGAGEYYHPQRDQGTLMCHYRHHAHSDPFYLPGLQDITVHVDFSAIAHTAIDHGLAFIGYTTQAMFLLGGGLEQVLARYDQNDVKTWLPITNAVQKLTSPAEMGELFKVIGFGKNFNHSPSGFTFGDRSRSL